MTDPDLIAPCDLVTACHDWCKGRALVLATKVGGHRMSVLVLLAGRPGPELISAFWLSQDVLA